MISQWYELREAAVALRKAGMSIRMIEDKLGIPRSTLSGWFKDIELTELQKNQLLEKKRKSWAKARIKASESHRANKVRRIIKAEKEAELVMNNLRLDGPTLDIAFAMLYFGEGSKDRTTSIANSNPLVLKFVLAVLKQNYCINPEMVRCELHLRSDQSGISMKEYWSKELGIPVENFRSVMFDQRTKGRPTFDHYKGVCVIYCGDIAIQRKLMYLYTLFCSKVITLITEGD